jgi:hypothetical protein
MLKHARRAAIVSLLALGAAAGCTAGQETDPVTSSASALTLTSPALPSDPNWAPGLSKEAIQLGTDNDGSALYACRAYVGTSLAPGKTKSSWSICDVSYGGHEYSVSPYQTLVAVWTPETSGALASGAFAVGSESGTPVYGCRAAVGTSEQVGKIKTGFTGCDYPYGGVEAQAASYSVLVGGEVPLATTLRPDGSSIPLGAVPAGTDNDGTTLYSCATQFQGAWAVGKTKAAWNGCDVSWGGREYMVSGGHQIVVAQTLMGPDTGTVPIVAGKDSDGSSLGVCSVPYGGGIQVGKYLSWGACSFGYGGVEIAPTKGFSVVAAASHPSIWSEINGGQPASVNTSHGVYSCAFAPTFPLVPSSLPSQCTAGVLNQNEPVWACPTGVDAQIHSALGALPGKAGLPKCNVDPATGVVTSPNPPQHCEVVYTLPMPPTSESCFAGGAKTGMELVWDHEFIPEAQEASDGGTVLTSCQVMGCGGACPASPLLPH